MSDPYPVTFSMRDHLKKDHPAQYGEMLELLIAGKVVIVPDRAGDAQHG